MPAAKWNVDADKVKAVLIENDGNITLSSEKLGGVSRDTLIKFCRANGIDYAAIRENARERKNQERSEAAKKMEKAPTDIGEQVLKALGKSGNMSLLELCDVVNLSPSAVLTIVEDLHGQGYRIPSPDQIRKHGHVHLQTQKDSPYVESNNVYDLEFDGDTYLTATVSDTHFSSVHEHPEYVHAAYDMIEELGITDVYHGGDLTCGMNIYPGQINEVKHARIDTQTDQAVIDYPTRKGITTKIIAGNHDIEGAAGRIGVNPLRAFCDRRPDFQYLGEYSAFFNLPNGARVQMLHPMGGGSYAISYRIQKHIESYTEAQKPDILWVGHFHRAFYMPGIRNMHSFLLGTFEGQSTLAKRRALGEPGLGFWVHKITMKPRGVVAYQPTWYDFLDGVPDLMEAA